MNFATLLQAPLVTRLCACALLAFTLVFVAFFIVPGIRRWHDLSAVIRGLEKLKSEKGDPGPLFGRRRDLKHLWNEFLKSLFAPREFDSVAGCYVAGEARLTVPAQQIFHTEAVVDSYLSAEFFKHLPGLVTGIGLIGTFFGVLHGLQHFSVTDNPQVVRSSLSVLLQSVAEAFLVSAFAIFLAMLFTAVEKFFISRLYAKTERIVVLLDSMYRAGAGEQMLEELVHSSKEYVSNSKTLKDSLVNELKGILSSLSENQIEAHRRAMSEQIQAQSQTSAELGKQIGEYISDGLKNALEEPMKVMADALQSASGDRTTAVHSLLTDVVQGLNQSLKDLFGDQIAGINTMQQQTIAALQSAVTRMEQMSSSLENAGTRATETMASRMDQALASMESRQETLARQMAQVVEEMKSTVASSQTETNARLQESLSGVSATIEGLVASLSTSVASSQDATSEKLESALTGVTTTVEALIGTLSQNVVTSQTETNDRLQTVLVHVSEVVEKLVSEVSTSVATTQSESYAKLQETVSSMHNAVGSMMNGLTQQTASAEAAHAARQQQLAAQAETSASGLRETVATLAAQVESLVHGTRSAVEGMRAGVDSMRNTTADTVRKMNEGAETMYVASSEFAKAGQSVAGVLQQATGTSERLAAASTEVGAAAQTMQGVVLDYRAAREQLQATVDELSRVVENAHRDASITTDVLSRIEASTQALGRAHVEVDQFLDKVVDLLGESFGTYQQQMSKSMSELNTRLVDQTSSVTRLLAGTIANLERQLADALPQEGA